MTTKRMLRFGKFDGSPNRMAFDCSFLPGRLIDTLAPANTLNALPKHILKPNPRFQTKSEILKPLNPDFSLRTFRLM